jgi:hypothetical protein
MSCATNIRVRKLRPRMARLRNGWRKLSRGQKAAHRGGSFRWICKPRHFSGGCGRNCSGFRGARPGHIVRLRGQWENRERCERWHVRALRIRFRSWCRAIEWCGRTGISLDIDGDCREKKNCWSGSGRRGSETVETGLGRWMLDHDCSTQKSLVSSFRAQRGISPRLPSR